MNGTGRTILTLAAGAVAGAVTALLLAPQTGADTRRGIRKTVSRVSDDLGSTVQNGIERIKGMAGGELESNGSATASSSPSTGRRQSSGTSAAGSTSGGGGTL